jgi:TusA-related sulfurtransferase
VVIRATDRVADVLARDEALVDVFVAAAPAFERLRNPAMRRVMARLVTVEQAARVAGVDAERLLRSLNDACGAAGTAPAATDVTDASAASAVTDASATTRGGIVAAQEAAHELAALVPPAALAAISPDRVIDLDVRDDLRNGDEPFSRIMAARRALAPDGALRLRAIFEPVPLYEVFGKQGLAHWTDRLADDDWIVWFYTAQPDAGPADTARGAGAAATGAMDGPAADVAVAGAMDNPAADDTAVASVEPAAHGAAEPVVLDVRGLEPPEPMVRTLEALAALPPGGTLIQLNVRVPQMLLPQLDARGCTYVVHTEADDRVRVVIHAPAGATQQSINEAAP